MSSQLSHIPKGLHHLESASRQFPRWPSRLPHGPTQWVPTDQRIRRWNIRPGDKVRLLVGKPAEKYVDEREKAAGGWKVYNVKNVDMERNWVYLDGLSNKRSVTVAPKPANFDSLDKDVQDQYNSSSTVVPKNRPVHYSNVQLCVEENGADSVFASRVSTSTPRFDKAARTLRWDRYASKLSGPSSIAPDPTRGLVNIAWPDKKGPEMPPAGRLDSTEPLTSTLHLPPLTTLTTTSAIPKLVPTSLRARPPASSDQSLQSVSNAYIASSPDPSIDSAMPLYLSEELSPRFSRAKKTRGWNERRLAEAEERERIGREAVNAWEAGGRDTALASVLPEAGLEGVTIRSRTRKEVREAAVAAYDAELAGKKVEVREARRGEKIYDYKVGKWRNIPGGKTAKADLKRKRKVARAKRLEVRLSNLKLEEGRNMVVPADARA